MQFSWTLGHMAFPLVTFLYNKFQGIHTSSKLVHKVLIYVHFSKESVVIVWIPPHPPIDPEIKIWMQGENLGGDPRIQAV